LIVQIARVGPEILFVYRLPPQANQSRRPDLLPSLVSFQTQPNAPRACAGLAQTPSLAERIKALADFMTAKERDRAGDDADIIAGGSTLSLRISRVT